MKPYSVLMSVYIKESADWFRKSIESMLNQTAPTDDFVIVCDGSLTEELDEVIEYYLEKFPNIFNIVRLPKNMGLGIALNEGLKYCKHELVARMDSDDIAVECRCEQQLHIMNDENIAIVGSWVTEFEHDPTSPYAERRVPELHNDIVSWSKKRNPFNHPSVMYRKGSVVAAGGYQDFYLFEDYYLWLRMLNKGVKAYNIQAPLLLMRAGVNMYARRGGIKYAKSLLAFRRWMKKNGFISYFEFLYIGLGHALVAVLPKGLRKMIYSELLRV